MTSSRSHHGLLLVGLGSQGRPYLSAGRKLGLHVTVVDRASALGSQKTQRMLDKQVKPISIGDSPVLSDWYAAAHEAASDYSPDGIVAFSEEHVIAAALVADKFGTPGPGLRAALTSRDKSLQRATFAKHNITQPQWCHAHTFEEGASWLSERPRAVAKPLDRGGSDGVQLVSGLGELRTWHADEIPTTFLLEEYIDGDEYSVELLVRAGALVFANVTAKRTTAPPRFVETGHIAPAALTEHDSDQLLATAMRIIAALGMGTGIAHVELRQTAAGPVVMEVAVRTPGDYIMEMLGAAWGINLFEQVIRIACGWPTEFPAQPAACSEVVFPKPDEIAKLPLTDLRSSSESGVVLSTLTAKTGNPKWSDSSSRSGAVVLVADNHADLARRRSQLLGSPSSAPGYLATDQSSKGIRA